MSSLFAFNVARNLSEEELEARSELEPNPGRYDAAEQVWVERSTIRAFINGCTDPTHTGDFYYNTIHGRDSGVGC